MNHIYGHPHSKKAEFYKLLLDYDESLERDLADCRAIWYESGTHSLMVGDYGITDRLESMIISKNFGFIERLVKHNKIDDSKVGNSDMLSVQYHDLVNDYKYEGLIMILSISENPISDLCSFLK